VKQNVLEGRIRVNFSTWATYPKVRRLRLLSDVANQVQLREMPDPLYLRIHGEAKLSDAEIAAIFAWTQAERTRLILQTTEEVTSSER